MVHNNPSVELHSVTKTYPAKRKRPTVTAVNGIDLAIVDGEFFTLLGASGCGKTTTLRMIGGFDTPTSGRIMIDGVDMTDRPPHKRPVNTVFQNYALFPHLTVADNIAYGLQIKKIDKREHAKRVSEALAMVQLPDARDAWPTELSGGQQQRVALARALVNRPKLLLLDEPLSALDLKLRQSMRHELKQLQSDLGITFIYVTHDQEEALAMSDRIAVMNAGEIAQIADPETLYTHPANRYVATFIGEMNFIDGDLCGMFDDVTVAVRPEKLHIAPASNTSHLAGTIIKTDYIGTDRIYTVQLPNEAHVTTLGRNLNGHAPLPIGTAVDLWWTETAAHTFNKFSGETA